jgi:hypothetical protein
MEKGPNEANHIWAGTVSKILPDNQREVVFLDKETVVYCLSDLQLRVIRARNYLRKHPFDDETILHGAHPYQPGVEVRILFDKGLPSEKVYRGIITDCCYKKRFGSKAVCHDTKATALRSRIMYYKVVYEDGDTRWYTAEKLDRLRNKTIQGSKKIPYQYHYVANGRSDLSQWILNADW